MENYSIIIFIMALMIGLSAVADKLRVPYPILLIMAGIAVGFIPAILNIELNPEIVSLFSFRLYYTMPPSISGSTNSEPISTPLVHWLSRWYSSPHRA